MSNYCIAKDNKEHLMKLIDIIYDEVLSSGGDGDALWYSKYYSVADLKPFVEEYNSTKKFPWKVELSEDGKTIQWGDNQEWATITNDLNLYNTSPTWIQMKIIY